ncbi:hypothetical protein NA78x_001276 [Anatilimnocola sp. NA78]|uniref:hypothetical protein n=1 Tax=Anatilimnocola sp. NA78 TaxID=3415683 RepID=UPI003CE4BC33
MLISISPTQTRNFWSRLTQMKAVKVSIIEWASDDYPGFVRCELIDAWQQKWYFIEKVPVMTTNDLWNDSRYPQPGKIACVVISRQRDSQGREVFTVDTSKPCGVESQEGISQFDVLADQLEET